MRPRRAERRRGFTLIEAALTTVIVGVGVVATLELLAAGTVSNAQGVSLTEGLNLAHHVRERTLDMPAADVQALNGAEFSPPLDARGLSVANAGGWAQRIVVQGVDEENLVTVLPLGSSPISRVTVTILRDGQDVCSTSWIIAEID